MRRNIKQVFSLLISIILIIGTFTISISAEEITPYQDSTSTNVVEQISKDSTPMTVETTYGLLSGVSHDGEYSNITSFKGIPYATAPIGDLRWAPPEDPESWEGVKVADTYALTVIQNSSDTAVEPWKSDFYPEGTPDQSEDGLYLNVVTSYAGDSDIADRPVFIWFHGGGLNHGFSYEVEFNGEELAKKGVVVVTVGHRLNSFGYLALPQLTEEQGSSGNYGLMDQFKALDWVMDNIEAFGGNSDNITVGGQSGGASKSMAMAISPKNQGRIKNIIMQSGLQYNANYASLETAQNNGKRYLQNLGLDPDISLERLRLINPKFFLFGASGSMIQDGEYIVHSSAKEAIDNGALNGINVLTGTTLGEQNYTEANTAEEFYANHKTLLGDLYDKYDFENLVRVTDETANDTARKLAAYGTSTSAARNLMTDRLFGNHLSNLSDGESSVYAYLFSHITPSLPEEEGTIRDMKKLWAWHSSDLWYSFGSLRDGVPVVRPWTAYDFELADKVSSYWANFMKTGDPNGDGLATWPKADETLGYMDLGDEIVGHSGKNALESLLAEFASARFGLPNPEMENLKFDLIVDVLEWGSATTAVIIDAQEDIDSDLINLNTFSVSAVTNNPVNGNQIYKGPRTITKAYVSQTNEKGTPADSGRYIVLELKYGYDATAAQVNGSSAVIYQSRNYWLNMDYKVTQNKAIGTKPNASIVYNDTIRPIFDDFELFDNPVEGYTQQKYRMYVPPTDETDKPLPLILFNHGGGETYAESAEVNNEGSQLFANLGGVGWIKNAPEDCYILVPQRNFSGYSIDGVIAFIEDLIAKGEVDGDRVYIAGPSAGGRETHNFLVEYPHMFAAAMPICPAGGSSLTTEQINSFKHVPIWYVHAETDITVPPINSLHPYETLVELGARDARRTVFPYVFGTEIPTDDYNHINYPDGHWSWVMMLNNVFVEDEGYSFMDWLFSQKKSSFIDISTEEQFGAYYYDDKVEIIAGATLAIAQYDLSGRLIVYKSADINTDEPTTLFMDKDVDCVTCKAFVWNGNIAPLEEALILK